MTFIENDPFAVGVAIVLIVCGLIAVASIRAANQHPRPRPPLPDPDDTGGVNVISNIMCGPCGAPRGVRDFSSPCSCTSDCGKPACAWHGAVADGLSTALRRITEGDHG